VANALLTVARGGATGLAAPDVAFGAGGGAF
jgi:hypothetical protein